MSAPEDRRTGKEVARWADESMFTAEAAKATGLGGSEVGLGDGVDYRPTVRLLDAPADPLGKLACIAKAYQGKFPQDYAQISDEDRLYYVQDMEKNILGMPSEAVQFHFVLENVTRSFTHQLVRTRHASYAQESMRFAVKEDFPVQMPPSLIGTKSRAQWRHEEEIATAMRGATEEVWLAYEERYASPAQRMRFKWDEAVAGASEAYLGLIDMGMPAEDARGLSPHAIVTRINWVVDLRALMATAGQRLCTQAQWEHREMWGSLIKSIRDYGRQQRYQTVDPARGDSYEDNMPGGAVADPKTYPLDEVGDHDGFLVYERSSAWQFEFLANRFKPVCYQTGRCQFRSDFDRFCNIRDRVEENAAIGRPSSEWHKEHLNAPVDDTGTCYPIIPIRPTEWLDPNAAIRPDAEWRSDEALNNIRGRR